MSILSADPPRDAAPLLVKPADAARMLGCGRTRIYELVNAGEIDSFRDGRSRKIIVASIHAYVARRLAADGTTSRATPPPEPRTLINRRRAPHAAKALGRIGIRSGAAGRHLT